MGELAKRPLVCVAVAFAAGVAAAAAFSAAAVAAAGAIAGIGTVGWAWRRGAWSGLAGLGWAAVVGAAAFLLGGVRPATDVSRLPEGGQTLVGTVAGAPRYSDGIWRFVLTAEEHLAAQRREAVGGRVYVRLTSTRPVARGDRFRLTGRLRELRGPRNPGGRSEARRLASLGVRSVLTVGAEELAEPLGRGQLGWVARHAYAAQGRALRLLERHVPGPFREATAGVAGSVIFGVHAAPPPAEITEDFRRAGTIHLLVVSGAMVSMVFSFVFLPGALGAGWRRLQAERQAGLPVSGRGRIRHWPGLSAAVIGVLVVTYYAILTEGGQAVARGAVMGVVLGLAFALRRVPAVAREHGLNVDHYTLLAVAALVILATDPSALFQPGFQLSFVAVWAIIYLTPKLEPAMRWLPRWLALAVGGTLAAQLATFPILAWHYGQAPIGGLAANLAAVPLAGVVLAAGMTTCALGVLLPWVAPAAGWVTGRSAWWLIRVSSAVAAVPGVSPEVARPGWTAIMAWYAGLLLLGWWLARWGERRRQAERGWVGARAGPRRWQA